MHPRAICAAVVLAATASAFGSPSAAPVRGALEGKELPLANEARSGFESVAGSLLGGGLKGQVTRVVVEEDAPRRLTVRVSYEGFPGAKLWGELLTGDRRRQIGIAMGEPVTLADAAADVELMFEAVSGITPTPSAVLRISVAAPNRRSASYVRLFRLGKEWLASEVSGADFSVTISPRPIGRTAQLGPTPALVVPGGTARVSPSAVSSSPSAPVMARAITPAAPPAPAPATRPLVAMRSTAIVSKAALQALPPAKSIQPIRASFYGLNPTDANNGALGPAALPLRPFGDVRTEDINLDLTRVLNVFPEVYQDQRPSSGIFYVLPHGYALKWDEADGYAFRTIYAAASTPGASGQVMMAARLDAGFDARDFSIASKIVKAYADARQLTFTELRPLPIDTLSVSISDDLGRYSIPADRVSVHGLSDITGQLEVSWVTDERTKNFIQEALVQNVGINGSVTYAPTGRGLGPRMVPVRMQLADYSTFGPFRWDRTGWKNPTPYPITLRYLHALSAGPGGTPIVNSWSLGDTRVPPGGQVRWSSTSVPFWLDAQALKMWIDYAVDQTCTACGSNAIATLTGGVSTAGSSQITFHSLTPLAETGAHDVQVQVRSRYFDPRGEQMQMRSFVVDADEKDFLVGPVFVDGAAGSPGAPMFEFRLSLTMKDGDIFTGNAAWIPGDALRMPIGRRQLERSLGNLPGH